MLQRLLHRTNPAAVMWKRSMLHLPAKANRVCQAECIRRLLALL
jgi:hypothetical protein